MRWKWFNVLLLLLAVALIVELVSLLSKVWE